MLHPDRLGARINNWYLLLIGGLSFFLYEALQAPFYSYSAGWIAVGIMVGGIGGVFLPMFALTRRLGIPFRVQFQIGKMELVPTVAIIGATLSAIPTLEIITAKMSQSFPPEDFYVAFIMKLAQEGWGVFSIVILALTIAVPFAEELLFRGLLQRVLLRHSRAPLAVVVIALLFAAVHPLYAMPGVFLLGLFLGAIPLLLGNLSYSILAHAIWNLTNLLVLKLTPGALDPELVSPFTTNTSLWLLISLALVTVFGRLALRYRE